MRSWILFLAIMRYIPWQWKLYIPLPWGMNTAEEESPEIFSIVDLILSWSTDWMSPSPTSPSTSPIYQTKISDYNNGKNNGVPPCECCTPQNFRKSLMVVGYPLLAATSLWCVQKALFGCSCSVHTLGILSVGRLRNPAFTGNMQCGNVSFQLPSRE